MHNTTYTMYDVCVVGDLWRLAGGWNPCSSFRWYTLATFHIGTTPLRTSCGRGSVLLMTTVQCVYFRFCGCRHAYSWAAEVWRESPYSEACWSSGWLAGWLHASVACVDEPCLLALWVWGEVCYPWLPDYSLAIRGDWRSRTVNDLYMFIHAAVCRVHYSIRDFSFHL